MGLPPRKTTVAAALCAAALAVTPALASVSGPAVLKPGKAASFKVTGLPKGKALKVKVATTDGGGFVVHKKLSSSKQGTANVSFNVPTKYIIPLGCEPSNPYAECTKMAWKDDQRVKLKVCPKGGHCKVKALKIKK